MRIRLSLCVLCFSVLVFTFSCARSERENKGYVIASSFPSYTLARSIMGDESDVKMLLPAGIEAHNYEPNPKTMVEVASADLIIFTGGESDAWLDTILESIDNPPRVFRMVDYTYLIPVKSEHNHHWDNHHDEIDEHVWLSFENQIILAEELEKVLSELNPKESATYKANRDIYIRELEELRDEYSRVVSNSDHNKIVFASRFPFRYLFDEFGLDYEAAFPGCNENTEPNARTVASLIKSINDNKLSYVLNTEFSSESLPRLISEETGSSILRIHSMHNIELDRFHRGDDFISIMKENLEVLKKALN